METLKNKEICPVCGKKITVGVMNRVMQLSDREDLTLRKKRSQFYSLIPLKEILSEITDSGPNSKKVLYLYYSLIQKLGTELDLLLNKPIDEIKISGGDEISEAQGLQPRPDGARVKVGERLRKEAKQC